MIRFLPLSFFRWCINTPVAQVVKQSKWGFAILETFHIVGFTILLGAILVTDLAVLGLGMRQPADRIAKEATRWGLAGLAIVLLSGIPMFMSAATTYSTSFPFLLKMVLLLACFVLQFSLTRFPAMYKGTFAGKMAACVSLICWMGVAYAGRAIAFEVLFGTAD